MPRTEIHKFNHPVELNARGLIDTQTTAEKPAALNIREIRRETFYGLKMAATAEHKTVRRLVLELIEEEIQELERKGIPQRGSRSVSLRVSIPISAKRYHLFSTPTGRDNCW